MKKNLGAFLVLLLLSAPVWGQQRPQFSQFMINSYLLNPAITGIEDYTEVKMGTRQQWVGLEGAPKTYHVSAHTPLNKQVASVRNVGKGMSRTRSVNKNRFMRTYPHHGVGIQAISDRTGPLRRTNVNLTYAYHLPVTRSITVSMGASAGILRNSINASEATFTSPGDPAIASSYVNRNYFDLGLGTWIYSNTFFVGLSGAQLLRSNRDLNLEESETTSNNVLQKHFIGTAGYKFNIGQEVTLIPSVLVKLTQPSPTTIDFNLRALYAERVWAGVSYRSEDAFAVMTGVNISHIMDVSYSYDYNTSPLSIGNTGSHEVVLGLKLFNRGKVICPRWMH
ncbi:type IX secretion system membrane protein PorP/SprF [Rufibacter glacialis]|uniref:Type IX secretion system membrane protein PorP/SprF n=1 Tax=Rufibacter glacialis TaxID=1259555 RepID=A0A5M8Q9Z0_9BACT|nr:type IX secretion system membrane protein PorP/SprF [Rufibacter glacialis]KAA6431656.1 type IX secretion system membrane protein PorP/SprF [Rufibacter glacialis]GGK82653.1 membrane protein [Rufibacter glacialis]